ncbi:MAG TPA: XRE family transcriptional regulator [Tepidisphaeraceae bacterium]|jgi:phage repressor protein C with HTH and peptisase S24 domain|nr:XRE family transcriptional regulator [Tepidisphaeraceae bacterium]
MEPLGDKIRKQRRRLGLTLDELSGRAGISKPYLSLIETGRVANPPSDEKLQRLEQTLGFVSGELLTQAHLQRTPRDVREALGKLLNEKNGDGAEPAFMSSVLHQLVDRAGSNVGSNVQGGGAVPVINRVSAGYPTDFTDLAYPPRVADQFVGCPEICDKDAFAARVHGDSMTPKYREGDIVIFSPSLAARGGDDCFVRFGDGRTTFKRIFFETDGEGRAAVVRLQPRNEKYRATLVKNDQVSGLYRAVYRYQRVDGD